MTEGFDPKHRRVIDSILECSPAASRQVRYHALARLACLGALTPYALDAIIEVADVEDELRIHTKDFAPATTDLPGDSKYLDLAG